MSDNNVRYAALQNLAALATSNYLEAVLDLVHVIQGALDGVFLDRDPAIVLHTLRLIKQLAKHDAQSRSGFEVDVAAVSTLAAPSPGLLRLLLSLVKPKHFQRIDSRNESTLQAAFCDVLAEMSEAVFAELTTDQRALVITYLLTKAKEDVGNGKSTLTRASAIRGLGVLITYKLLRQDLNFVVDVSEKLLDVLKKVDKIHKNVVTSAVWSLANLADGLAAEVDNEDAMEDEYPKHLIVSFLEILTSPFWRKCHMNVRVSVVRSVGCFLRLIDDSYAVDLEDSQKADLLSIVRRVCIRLIEDIEDEKDLVKVQWNGCYVAKYIFFNDFLNREIRMDDDVFLNRRVVLALIYALKNSANFKVKMNAASALMSESRRISFPDDLGALIGLLVKEVELADNDDNVQETQHRSDLLDTLCQLVCHVIGNVASNAEDFAASEAAVPGDAADVLRFAFSQANKRLSPERLEVFMTAESRLEQESAVYPMLNSLFTIESS